MPTKTEIPIERAPTNRQASLSDSNDTTRSSELSSCTSLSASSAFSHPSALGSTDFLSRFHAAVHILEGFVDTSGSDSETLKIQKDAKDLLRKLARTGMREACTFLAECYENGTLGFKQCLKHALSLNLRAAKQNDPDATYRIAVAYEKGSGTKRDLHKAVQYHRKAGALGNLHSMFWLGVTLLNGKTGISQNESEAVRWLKLAIFFAGDSLPEALFRLATVFENPTSAEVVPDPKYCLSLYERAAAQGHTEAQFRLGVAYEHGQLGLEQIPSLSIDYYHKAAGKHHAGAQLALSGWFLVGIAGVIKASEQQALSWAIQAANQNLPQAEFALGYFHEHGIGTEVSMETALGWYKRAAAHNCISAKERLLEEPFAKKSKRKQKKQPAPTQPLTNKVIF